MDSLQHRDDPDSAYGDEAGSHTISVAFEVLDYTFEYNRRYHAYQECNYPFPFLTMRRRVIAQTLCTSRQRPAR